MYYSINFIAISSSDSKLANTKDLIYSKYEYL